MGVDGWPPAPADPLENHSTEVDLVKQVSLCEAGEEPVGSLAVERVETDRECPERCVHAGRGSRI